MFNNQSNRRPGNPIVGIIVPILIYWGISFLVDMVVVAAYLIAHGQELMQAYESQSALQTFMEETMTFILGHSTEITSASALLALPFYIYMMRKDERYRKMFVEPDAMESSCGQLCVYGTAWGDSRDCTEQYSYSE